VRGAIPTLARELAEYDRVLGASSFLAGNAPTAADFVVLPHVQSILRAAGKPAAREFEIPFLPFASKHPALAAWLERMAQLPGYERTYPPNWR
jgi:glutathione S-transferase